ncbi:phosphatase PAP2 family protein [Cyanobium sp. WAJ14-Wanaka]|uniref:phosphatase PAP2 family protein n=1 Tax=Cyanobium sp. WAJ14-Wanaka TaxID=2823725 RepID=UPI0020CC656C|nr:phosphatase PAP2 family protein [Cyanobium sp. WAJ14-Wanaka]MCP9775926.1 phosphatase PAP2 family protein [Cyanobium sp. WAJ14-Wanaka]
MSAKQLPYLIVYGVVILSLSHLLDFPIAGIFRPEHQSQSDLFKLFRCWGFLGTWVLITISAQLLSQPTSSKPLTGWKRYLNQEAWMLIAAPMISGSIAEIIKLIVRRIRPHGDPSYIFRSWLDRPFSTSGIGFPSSHTAVAFAGSTIIIYLYPRLKLPAIIMAAGCLVTRVVSGAHYFSDGIGGALVGISAGFLCIWLSSFKKTWQ